MSSDEIIAAMEETGAVTKAESAAGWIFECNVCKFRTLDEQKARKHGMYHTPPDLECATCGSHMDPARWTHGSCAPPLSS